VQLNNSLNPSTLEIIEQQSRDGRINCPECTPDRKKKHERTLSITVAPTETLYYCHHCGIAGRFKRDPFYEKYQGKDISQPKAKAKIVQIPTQLNSGVNKIDNFFAARGTPIDEDTKMPHVIYGNKYFRDFDGTSEAIGFVYGAIDEPEAIKWRPIDRKGFSQDGAARTFWGADLIPDDAEVVTIVEGECDVVALATMGVVSVSCPNGAPKEVSKSNRVEAKNDVKFSYVWSLKDKLENAKRVVLAVDGDSAGEALAEELARRIGRAKCWRVEYPKGCKDATDVINEFGKDAMRLALSKATPMPLHGVYSAAEYMADLHEIYLKGHGKGQSTGLIADELFTIAEGQLSVVTGIPNSGKSEFIDQIMVNLAMQSDWKFAVASFENQPHMHIAKMAEKVVGKPFYEGVTPRMTRAELDDATVFINDHFTFLDSKDGAVATVDSIIDRAKQAVMRLGVRGLIIDPYNYIESSGEQEHKHISDMLTKIVTFAKAYGIHVFFIAHPKGMVPLRDGSFPVPTGMHISGGPTWFAKADIGITVHRGEHGVEIHCWKCRHKWIGKQGMVLVDYDVPTGRYKDYPTGRVSIPSTSCKEAIRAPKKYQFDDIKY